MVLVSCKWRSEVGGLNDGCSCIYVQKQLDVLTLGRCRCHVSFLPQGIKCE